MKKDHKWLLGILLLGLVIRVYRFGQLPLSLNRDEVSLGYNAYALLEEGVDEWGESWPVTFKSFGDYKLPGYIYLLIPFIKVFGLKEWVVRLPSLLAGLVNIWLIFLLTKTLLPKNKVAALLSAAFMALSPWAMFYSRIGFEAHVSLSYFLGFIYLLFRLKEKSNKIFWALLLLAMAILTYNAPLILAPFVLGSFLLLNRRIKSGWVLLVGGVLVVLMGAGLLINVSSAKTGISIFTDSTIATEYRESRVKLAQQNPLLGSTLGNRVVYYGKQMLVRYVKSFLPQFLVISGGQHPWHQVPDAAHFGWLAYSLFIFGIIKLVIKKDKDKDERWLIFLLLVSPLPAIVTVDAPHATRSLLLFTLMTLVAGLGAGYFMRLKSKKKLTWILILLFVVETSVYLKKYFVDFPQNHSASWKVGLKEAIAETKYRKDEVSIIDYKSSPYIYVLFYNQVLPSVLLSDVEYYPPDNAGLTHVKSFGKYIFVETPVDAGEGIVISEGGSGRMEIMQ